MNKWNKKPVDVLPEIGSECACGGHITQGKFDLLCAKCGAIFKLNKPQQQEEKAEMILIDAIDKMNERLDNLAEYLKDELADIKRYSER